MTDTKPATRLLLADDQLLVRAGIRSLIQTLPEYVVVAECAEPNAPTAWKPWNGPRP